MTQALTSFDIASGTIRGNLKDICVLPSELTEISVENINSKTQKSFLASEFKKCLVKTKENGFCVELSELEDNDFKDISVKIEATITNDEASFKTEVTNNNPSCTVLYADYPHFRFSGSEFDAFLPKYGGIVEENIIGREYGQSLEDMLSYPCGFHYTMQYFAFYNKDQAVYTAIHDKTGALKRFGFKTCKDDGSVEFVCRYPSEGMGLCQNSFSLSGEMVWKSFSGDWYDATLIYGDFVHKNALWLGEKYRPDTPQSFKEIPLWIMDWLPNSPDNPDPVPESVRQKVGITDSEAWINKPIELSKKLGVPLGYHLYNWHQIPFNNDYPHYFPEKPGVREGIKRLKEAGISVMPYINGKLWDTLDRGAEDFEFSSKAKKWAAKKTDGSVYTEQHASHEKTGDLCTLAMMCPSTKFWQDKMSEIVGKLFYELDVDGVYLDQIAASMPRPCCDQGHPHTPGGGSWWVEGYEKMLDRLKKEIPKSGYLTTECNAEAFAKNMDGFLTWIWLHSNSVPAFSVIFSKYVTMFGRNTNGKKEYDTPFFKSNLAQSLLYGQSLGWISPRVLEDDERFRFTKKLAALRYKKTKSFTHGTLLRPPKVTSNIPTTTSEPAMSFTDPYVVEYVKSAIWQREDGKCEIFVINISNEEARAELVFDKSKYDVDFKALVLSEGGGNFETVEHDGDIVIKASIKPNDYMVLS